MINAKTPICNANIKAQSESFSEKKRGQSIMASGQFSVGRTPVSSELCWFKNDPYVNNLIKQILSSEGNAESHDLEINCSKYSVMSVSSAANIDAAILKIGAKLQFSMKSKVTKDQNSKLVLHMKF